MRWNVRQRSVRWARSHWRALSAGPGDTPCLDPRRGVRASEVCWHPKLRHVWRVDSVLRTRGLRRHPVVGHWLRTIRPIRAYLPSTHERAGKVRVDIFPHDVARWGHLEEAAGHAFADQGVAVGETARTAEER